MSENSKLQLRNSTETDEEGNRPGRRSSVLCRICQTACSNGNPLISPCNCKGTIGAVHAACLERWLVTACRSTCEICQFQYLATYTRRYTFLQSIRSLLQNPIRLQQFRSDMCNLGLMSIFVCLVTVMCLIQLESTSIEEEKTGLSQGWTHAIIGAFLAVLFFCYGWALGLIVRKQIWPWYRWWHHTFNVHITLIDNAANRHENENSLNNVGDVEEEGVVVQAAAATTRQQPAEEVDLDLILT